MIGYYLYLVYINSYFLHLCARIPTLGSIRFDLLIAACLFGFLLFSLKKEKNKEPDDISKWFKIILIYIVISLPLVRWPGSVFRFGFEFYIKAIIFFIFTVSFVNSEKKLRILMWVFMGCQVIRIIEPVYLHITEGYWGSSAYSMTGGVLSSLNRLSSAPADVLNPTQFGGLIVTIIPFLYFLLWKAQKILLKIFFLCLAPVCLYALFLTGARSGLISLLVVIIAITMFELGGKIKIKGIVYSLIIIIPLLFISFTLLPSDFQERYISTFDSSAKGHDTAVGRIKGLKRGLSRLLTIRAVFGYGLGTSAEANYHLAGHHIRSHSFYIETIQEIGIIGMIFFIKYIQSIFRSLARARQHLQNKKVEYKWNLNLIKAIQAWAAMFLVYCIICFGLNSWEWYFFGGISALSLKFAMQKQSDQEESKGE